MKRGTFLKDTVKILEKQQGTLFYEDFTLSEKTDVSRMTCQDFCCSENWTVPYMTCRDFSFGKEEHYSDVL